MATPATTERDLRRPAEAGGTRTAELEVSGMTCGSCAARVTRALERQEGVGDAIVNYATGRATVELLDGTVEDGQLVDAVRRAGYDAVPAAHSASEQAEAFDEQERVETREQASLLRRIALAVPLAAAIAALTYAAPHDQTARWLLPRWRCRCSSGAGCRSCARRGQGRGRARRTWTR